MRLISDIAGVLKKCCMSSDMQKISTLVVFAAHLAQYYAQTCYAHYCGWKPYIPNNASDTKACKPSDASDTQKLITTAHEKHFG